MFTLARSAARGWRMLRGHKHIPDLMKGIRFIDGIDERTLTFGDQTLAATAGSLPHIEQMAKSLTFVAYILNHFLFSTYCGFPNPIPSQMRSLHVYA
jgi:hypothetical protein